MSKKGFTLVKNDFNPMLKKASEIYSLLEQWSKREGYLVYQKAQTKRWSTMNASEGSTWKPLKSSYEQWKLNKKKEDPSKYPGGKKLLVLTGELFKSVTGKGSAFHTVKFNRQGFQVSTTLPYAKYVNETRDFKKVGAKTRQDFKNSLSKFVKSQIVGLK